MYKYLQGKFSKKRFIFNHPYNLHFHFKGVTFKSAAYA